MTPILWSRCVPFTSCGFGSGYGSTNSCRNPPVPVTAGENWPKLSEQSEPSTIACSRGTEALSDERVYRSAGYSLAVGDSPAVRICSPNVSGMVTFHFACSRSARLNGSARSSTRSPGGCRTARSPDRAQHQSVDRQDPRESGPDETRCPRSGPAGRDRLRHRLGDVPLTRWRSSPARRGSCSGIDDHRVRVRRMSFISRTRWSGSVGLSSNSGTRCR